MRSLLLLTSVVLGATLVPLSARAETVFFNTPDFDRWMYPFNSAPGNRNLAPTFGAVGSPDFDEFDGQFLVGFNTAAAGVPTAGALPEGMTYRITSVVVTATHSTGSFTYDPTPDPYASYLSPSDPNYVADTTPGRPIELYGAGLRGAYTQFGFGPTVPGPPVFEEGDLYTLGQPTGRSVRTAYAYDPAYGDVSNPVSDGLFDLTPWAVGQTDLPPGSSVLEGVPGVSAGSTFEFELDLSRPEIVDYLVEGLSAGNLFFTIVSLHGAGEMTGGANPNFYTRNNFDPAAVAPTLQLTYEIVAVPEPATWVLVACGLLVATPARLKARRRRSG